MMKASWGKPVSVIAFCRTLLIVLAVEALYCCSKGPVA